MIQIALHGRPSRNLAGDETIPKTPRGGFAFERKLRCDDGTKADELTNTEKEKTVRRRNEPFARAACAGRVTQR
jgi:hypothetical protein